MSDLTEDWILFIVVDIWLFVDTISTVCIEESDKGLVLTNVVAPLVFSDEYSIESVVDAPIVVWFADGVEVAMDVADDNKYDMDWEIGAVVEVSWLRDDSDWLDEVGSAPVVGTVIWDVSEERRWVIVVEVDVIDVSKSVTLELSAVFMVLSPGDTEDSVTPETAPVLLKSWRLVIGIEDRWSSEVTSEEEVSVVSSASTAVDDCWLKELEANDDVTTCLLVMSLVAVVIEGVTDVVTVRVVIIEMWSEVVDGILIGAIVVSIDDKIVVDLISVDGSWRVVVSTIVGWILVSAAFELVTECWICDMLVTTSVPRRCVVDVINCTEESSTEVIEVYVEDAYDETSCLADTYELVDSSDLVEDCVEYDGAFDVYVEKSVWNVDVDNDGVWVRLVCVSLIVGRSAVDVWALELSDKESVLIVFVFVVDDITWVELKVFW